MQTFLPYPDFSESAKCLDYRRLGKQRLEAKQIINLLEKHDQGVDITKLPWGNHPAVKMWLGHTLALKCYYNTILDEWISRGYNNTMLHYQILDSNPLHPIFSYPNWLGNPSFHDSHKSNLYRKDPSYYNQFSHLPSDLPYLWPDTYVSTERELLPTTNNTDSKNSLNRYDEG